MPNDSELKALKTAFAEALLRVPDDPFKAAFTVISDNGLALQAANLWVRDPFVIEEKKRLAKEYGDGAFLPSKEEQKRKLWEMANDGQIDPKERLVAHRLYAELNGFIEKPSTQVNVNNTTQTVMIVKDHGSNEQWESRAVAQQRTLISGNTGKVIDAAAN